MYAPVRLGLAMAITASFSVASCAEGPTQSSRIDRLVSTTSFGMCVGYCRTRLEITPDAAVLLREPGGRGGTTLPTQRFKVTLSPAEWQDITRLAEATKFDGLPAVIGCPDCADGGAESLEISGSGGTKSVSFDHGADIQPLQPLLDHVRALRSKLTPGN
ncbi:MAG: hypothetical protein ABL973_13475 [Micropepsaceae bacterium]